MRCRDFVAGLLLAVLNGAAPLAEASNNSARAPPTRRSLFRPTNVPLWLPAQAVDATQALNLSAGVSNCKVSRGRSFS